MAANSKQMEQGVEKIVHWQSQKLLRSKDEEICGLRIKKDSKRSKAVECYQSTENEMKELGVTDWLSGYSTGLEIQRSRVRIPSGAQENLKSFSETKRLC